jgi:hypothetical protein
MNPRVRALGETVLRVKDLPRVKRFPPPGKFGPVSDWVCPTGPREVMGPTTTGRRL